MIGIDEIRLAGITYRSANVVRVKINDTVNFVEDPDNINNSEALKVFTNIGGSDLHIGYVPVGSVPDVRKVIRLPEYSGAIVSNIGEIKLEEEQGVRIKLLFSNETPKFWIDCDCCVASCPTLEFEDFLYE